MTPSKLSIAVGIIVASLAISAPAQAQARGGHAVGRAAPRGPVAGHPPGGAYPSHPVYGPYHGHGSPYYGYGYRYPYYGYGYGYPYGYGFGIGFGYGGYGYGFGLSYGYPAYGYPAYGYPYGGYPYAYAPYGYGVAVRAYGGVRIDVPQKDAEVYTDGNYVGTVNDFDGSFQQLSLEPGPHRIEVRAQGFEPITFDVNVEPGRTITYRSALRPQQP